MHILMIARIVVSVNAFILKLYFAVGPVDGVDVTSGDTACVICGVGVSATRDNMLKL